MSLHFDMGRNNLRNFWPFKVLMALASVGLAIMLIMRHNSVEALPKSMHTIDAQRHEMFMRQLTEEERSDVDQLREKFYKMVTLTMNAVCANGRMVGGNWVEPCAALDGNKFVCFDDILNASNPCLIYSFGVGDEISFEEVMADAGCTVRLFDHTRQPAGRLHPQITHYRIGIGHETHDLISTLDGLLRKFSEERKEISYLKVDVEGAELKAFRGWIDSGALDNVGQIGIEMHTSLQKEDSKAALVDLVECFQILYRMGFRLISYEANGCAGKEEDVDKRYYTVFEIVFYRPRSQCW